LNLFKGESSLPASLIGNNAKNLCAYSTSYEYFYFSSTPNKILCIALAFNPVPGPSSPLNISPSGVSSFLVYTYSEDDSFNYISSLFVD